MLVTKQAFLQYYRKFSMTNFLRIYKSYRKRTQFTKFEKFVMFFELRLPSILVRIKYSKYILYSNLLILTGQIRVNGNIITLYDFQTQLCDIIEISYRAFFRQYFKKFIYRKYYKYHYKAYGQVYKQRSKYIIFTLKKKLIALPRWLYFGFVRAFRSSVFYAVFYHSPSDDYFVQSGNVLATILFELPTHFKDRRFSKFMTKKHMKFFSNFCTKYR